MPKINLPRESEHHAALMKSGHASVFDIIQHSRADFLKTVSHIDEQDACQIYREARSRAESLKSLYRSWQLRQEPILSGLKKMATPSAAQLQDTLLRNIGGDGDFSELMERSSVYADAASVQSLFSPGRYAASLYRVAKTLHLEDSELHIDKRRPDLKALILSEATVHQEVTSLDILLNVLQAETSNTLDKLSEAYFPMALPYDDRLQQIDTAMRAQGRSLNGVWRTLTEPQYTTLTHPNNKMLSRSTDVRAPETIDGDTFYLKSAGQMIYLAHVTLGDGQAPGAYLNIGKPAAEAIAVAPLKLTYRDEQYYLGVSGELELNNIQLTDCYLLGANGEETGGAGPYARMANPNAGGLSPKAHLVVDIQFHTGNGIKLKTEQGYLGYTEGPANDWENTLTINASIEDALIFGVYQDEKGTSEIQHPGSLVPFPPTDVITEPSPPARTTLSLTPVSYALMLKENPSEADIADHYGLKATETFAADAAGLAQQLNVIETFCQKTGLPFNQILELTAQADYARTATEAKNGSPYYKYGSTGEEDVFRYGATYLNGGLKGIQRPDERLLWIQPEVRNTEGTVTTPAKLNFKDETVTELAGRTEKLVRLKLKTGMSFERLDWVISNASVAAGFGAPTLDTTVLDALAGCLELQQHYGIDTNTAVSFIGAVNPYAKKQEASFYERTFIYPDLTTSIPLESQVAYATGNGVYEATCCKALGVTADEFSRIGQYCFGNSGTFTMSPKTAGQIYRFGAIPRMLGMTFAEAECLWQLMSQGTNNLLVSLGRDNGFAALDIIHRTEQVLGWMADNNLTLIQVQAMGSTQFSATATAEMFTFLQNVYHSVKGTTPDTRDLDAAQHQKMLRALAGGLGIKTNVMAGVASWLKEISSFSPDIYWTEIEQVFGADNASVETLQMNNTLVMRTQRLSQLVLIANWLNLSEQDLTLLVAAPAQLDNVLVTTPSPDLSLLLLLTRFKRWQTQVTVTRDEALRLLPYLAGTGANQQTAAEKIAAAHGLNAESVKSMSTALFDSRHPWPQSFAQLWQLLTWLRTGATLNVGTSTLKDLQAMSKNESGAEDAKLIARVASALSAGIGQR